MFIINEEIIIITYNDVEFNRSDAGIVRHAGCQIIPYHVAGAKGPVFMFGYADPWRTGAGIVLVNNGIVNDLAIYGTH